MISTTNIGTAVLSPLRAGLPEGVAATLKFGRSLNRTTGFLGSTGLGAGLRWSDPDLVAALGRRLEAQRVSALHGTEAGLRAQVRLRNAVGERIGLRGAAAAELDTKISTIQAKIDASAALLPAYDRNHERVTIVASAWQRPDRHATEATVPPGRANAVRDILKALRELGVQP